MTQKPQQTLKHPYQEHKLTQGKVAQSFKYVIGRVVSR